MLVEPRDPLIVRDGRPFTNSPGARARSLPFPLPQTVAGAYRTRRGIEAGLRFPEEAERTLAWGLRGPLLAERVGTGWRLMVPRPLDALRLGQQVYGLRPVELASGARTNLPGNLLPVALPSPELKEKPSPVPAFWYWESFLRWLLEDAPADFSPEGHDGPTAEVRTHVSLDSRTGTASEGALFQTSGLEFARKHGRLRGLALVLWPEDGFEVHGVHPLGGERRLAYWYRGGPAIPAVPEDLSDKLFACRAARVVLLTPAMFAGAYLPAGNSVLGAPVVAAAVGRPVVVSGWDLKTGRPKPTRRAVPAGSVYFVRLPQEWSQERVREWLHGAWFQNISDGEQDRRDGFGLAAVGVWSGELFSWREV